MTTVEVTQEATDYDTLLHDLRSYRSLTLGGHPSICDYAADAIERLQAKVKRLTALMHGYSLDAEEAQARVAELEAENRKLHNLSRGPLYHKPAYECATCQTPTTCAMHGRCMPIIGQNGPE